MLQLGLSFFNTEFFWFSIMCVMHESLANNKCWLFVLVSILQVGFVGVLFKLQIPFIRKS